MQSERKKIIRYALDYEIEDINTYSGYKGDLIAKIVTKDLKAAVELQRYARSLNILDVVVKHNPNLEIYEIYCVTKDSHVYHLKQEDIMEEVHSHHPKKDIWNGSK